MLSMQVVMHESQHHSLNMMLGLLLARPAPRLPRLHLRPHRGMRSGRQVQRSSLACGSEDRHPCRGLESLPKSQPFRRIHLPREQTGKLHEHNDVSSRVPSQVTRRLQPRQGLRAPGRRRQCAGPAARTIAPSVCKSGDKCNTTTQTTYVCALESLTFGEASSSTTR